MFLTLSLYLLLFLNSINASTYPPHLTTLKYPHNKPKLFYPIEGEYMSLTGIAVSPTTDEIFICDEELGQIFKFSGDQQLLVAGVGFLGFADGHLLASKFDLPQGISFHPNGSLLAVADSGNHVVRIVDLARATVKTLAGSPGKSGSAVGVGSSARFNRPLDVAFDAAGDFLYVADTGNDMVKRIQLATANVTVYAGTGNPKWDRSEGPATLVSLNNPQAIFYLDPGLLYISDTYNNAVRVVNGSNYLTTLVRDWDLLPSPTGLIIIAKKNILYVADRVNDYIVSIALSSNSSVSNNKVSIYAGSKDSPGFFDGLRLDAQFNQPKFLALSASLGLVISDYWNNAIRVISESSGLLYTCLRQRGSGYEDGLPSVSRFSFAMDIEFDPFRNVLYVADSVNNAIRRIHLAASYRVDTLTGKPYSGYIDGSLKIALFSNPLCLVLDPRNHSNLYVCDHGNAAIRQIDLSSSESKGGSSLSPSSSASAVVSTVHKSGKLPRSMTADLDGNFYVHFDSIYYLYIFRGGFANGITPLVGTGVYDCIDGLAQWSAVRYISSMIYDPAMQSVIFSDYSCSSVRVLSMVNENVSTIAGKNWGFEDGVGTAARLSCPFGLVSDERYIYELDFGNSAFRSINKKSQQVQTLIGRAGPGYRNGILASAQLFRPMGITILNDSTIFIMDSYNNVVRMVSQDQQMVTTIVGHGAPIFNSSSSLVLIASASSLLALDANVLLISDKINNCIVKGVISADDGMLDLLVLAGDGSNGWKDGVGTDSMFNWPTDMAIKRDRSAVYVADSKNHLIRRIQLSTGQVKTIAGGADINSQSLNNINVLNYPLAVAMDPSSDTLFIADSGNNCIKKISNGSVISIWAGSSIAGFKNGVGQFALFAGPSGLAFDPKTESLYVSDTFNHAIRKIDSRRVVTIVAGWTGTFGFVDGNASSVARFNYPTKIVLGRSRGELLILDHGNHAIRILDLPSNNVSTLMADADASFNGLACDDRGNIYVADSKAIRILRNPSAAPEHPDEASNSTALVAITASAAVIIITAVLFQRFASSRRKHAQKPTTVAMLQKFEVRNTFAIPPDASVTSSPSKTLAIAIPGYLNLDLESAVQFPSKVDISAHGGTANVFQAKLKDPRLIEKHGFVDVVIKAFGKSVTLDQFLYEVVLMHSLPKSPNLIDLIGYSEGRLLCIVMKNYPTSLRDLLVDKTFPNDPQTNLKIATDIANGMNLIHKTGIIHFDLKPANVLAEVTANGIWNYVICDFGFANFISDVQDRIIQGVKKPTDMGITARYAAPEFFSKVFRSVIVPSIKNYAPLDLEKKIDVYAYAMTLFYIYYRVAPWDQVPPDEIEKMVITGTRPQIPPTSHNVESEECAHISDLIQACWSQDPNDRPAFSEILEALSSSRSRLPFPGSDEPDDNAAEEERTNCKE